MRKTIAIFGICILLLLCCGKSVNGGKDEPVLNTVGISRITHHTALCEVEIESDGGSAVTVRGVCWSTQASPTIEDSKTEDGPGKGTFQSRITGLETNTAYSVRGYAVNGEGVAYGEELAFTTAALTVSDIDGNVYQTVTVGDQVWMAENLKTIHYRNGDAVPYLTADTSWFNPHGGAYCDYGHDPANGEIYGHLYNWYAVDDERGLAPEGWHMPSDEEWKELEMALGMIRAEADRDGWRGTDQGGKIKEAGDGHWNAPNTGATNESDFTALPSGYRLGFSGIFYNKGYFTHHWTTTEYHSFGAWYRGLDYRESRINRNGGFKEDGFSVRCVRN